MNVYTIRYISGKTLQPCFDSQTAKNILAAYDAHKIHFPHSRHVAIRRHSDGRWMPIGSDAI
jgi:phosphatidylserine decarboxylase